MREKFPAKCEIDIFGSQDCDSELLRADNFLKVVWFACAHKKVRPRS